MSEIVTQTVVINNPQGLHARPAYMFAELASHYDCQVSLVKEGERVNGKSILDIITLGAAQGTELVIEATGRDANSALAALAQLVMQGFSDSQNSEGDDTGITSNSQ
jgi:phosphotransferase system HPr (HPr) family protein